MKNSFMYRKTKNIITKAIYSIILWSSLLFTLLAFQYMFPIACKKIYIYIPISIMGIVVGDIHKMIWRSKDI
jgi:hypothetical protein